MKIYTVSEYHEDGEIESFHDFVKMVKHTDVEKLVELFQDINHSLSNPICQNSSSSSTQESTMILESIKDLVENSQALKEIGEVTSGN